MESSRANLAENKRPYNALPGGEDFGVLGITPRSVKTVSNLASGLAAPLTGLMVSGPGRLVQNLTRGKVDKETAGNVAGLAIPFVGEGMEAVQAAKLAKEANISPRLARLIGERAPPTPAPKVKPVVSPEHAARVARLEEAGVHLTPGMRQGGAARIAEEARRSHPYVGAAHAEADQKAVESMNRALFNRVLGPIGEHFDANAPVGREGVAHVDQQLSTAYDKALPHIKVNADHRLTNDLSQIRTGVASLGKPQEQQYEAILNQDVLHHFGPEGMDGHTFKKVESDLLRQSRNLKSSLDPNARSLGHALDDTLDALRSDMERSSPPQWRDRLRSINQSYAMFTRVQDAATHRATNGGVFTPGDLMASIRKGDRTVRKGAFARGDALLQPFAEDVEAVVPRALPDSGTPTRLMQGGRGAAASAIGSAVGAALGHVPGAVAGATVGPVADMAIAKGTNAVARRALERGSSNAVRLPRSRNRVLRQLLYGGALTPKPADQQQ